MSGKRARRQTDWLGLVLVAAGLSFLEFVLERGEESGWFHSTAIVVCTGLAAVTLTWMVIHEWRHEQPVLDLRLLANRNFAVASVLMLALSASAFGVTLLMPQYLWALMQYTPKLAGFVVSPGGLLIFCLLPITGRLVSRIDPRLLITFGFSAVGLATFYTARVIHAEMDFETAVKLRLLQCGGFAFLFVPIQMLAYSGVPKEKNNRAASVLTLARNAGASVGIAYVVTILFRNRQLHQVNLVAHATGLDSAFNARALLLAEEELRRGGFPTIEAARRAGATLYAEVLKQAQQLAYIDALTSLAAIASAGGALCWLARWPRAVERS